MTHRYRNNRHPSTSGDHENMLPCRPPDTGTGYRPACTQRKNFPARYLHKIAALQFFQWIDRQYSVELFSPTLFARSPQRLSFVKKRGDASPFPKKNAALPRRKKPFSPNQRIWGECPHSCRHITRRGKSMLCSPARPGETGLHAQQAGHTSGHRTRCAGRPCHQELHC